MHPTATANTADRSIAALDTALGRRFARIEVNPQPELLGDVELCGVRLADLLARLNARVLEHIDREHRIGHAYLMDEGGRPLGSPDELIFAVRYRVIPLLENYCLDDFEALHGILGDGFIDLESQTIRSAAFRDETSFSGALKLVPGLSVK